VGSRIDISILVPAHNEATRISPFLEQLLAFMGEFSHNNGTAFEVIVAEDGSSDETLNIVKRLASTCSAIRVLHHDHRLGKGGALRAAFNESRGEVVIFVDADGSYQPSEIRLFLEALEKSSIAIGTRSPKRMKRLPPIRRRVAGMIFNFLFRILFSSRVRDTQAGFKAFKRATFQALLSSTRTNGFEIDAEIIAKAQLLGLDLVEVPISYSYVEGSQVKVVRDGLAMASSLSRILIDNLSRRHDRQEALPLPHEGRESTVHE
jgi:hypothetical protein